MTKEEKIQDAELRSAQWLAMGNEHLENGDSAKAEAAFDKSQFWFDRANKLRGY